jgi:hypothetical protein
MIARPPQEDRVGGKIQIEKYRADSLNLDGWQLSKVLDDILMCQYADINEDGTQVKRGSIWVPLDVTTMAWRLAKVILAGPDCKTVKEGDYVIFPNDKGIQVANLNGLKHIVFLNEARIFGIAEPETKN